METYQEQFEELVKTNAARLMNLSIHKNIIDVANDAVKRYENEDGIDRIWVGYPEYESDRVSITVYLSEKGSIMKDIASFIDEIAINAGLDYAGEPRTNEARETRIWDLTDPNNSYEGKYSIRNAKVDITADASKSKSCKRVATGEVVPVYKFVCEDE